jgi:D-alanyl-D-alanine carboxypeptidase
MQAQHLPGLSLLVARRGQTLLAQSYGLANLELQVPAHNDSVYEIGSLTRSITAAVVLLRTATATAAISC